MRRLDLTAVLLAVALMAPACATGFLDSDGDDTDDGSGDGNGDGTPDPGDGSGLSCEEVVSLKVEVVTFPPDLLFVLDRSSSMAQPITSGGFDPRWEVAIEAVTNVVENYDGRVYPGLLPFPAYADTCGAGHVEITPSADSGKNFAEYLDDVSLGGAGSPLHTSLNSAISNFSSRAANPNGRYVLVASDGVPNCTTIPQDAIDQAIDAARELNSDGIKTYVVGVASGDDAAGVLDDLAAAGGTGSHFPADSAADIVAALEGITSSVTEVSCEYTLADGPDAATDLEVKIGYAEVAHSPDHTNGYDYDPVTHTLTFWGQACEDLGSSGDAQISANYCNVVD
jgi:hypothetical protein